MDRYSELLKDWCASLHSVQNFDSFSPFYGGFFCKVCGIYHGRADNAVFPFAYMYSETKDVKYLNGIKALLEFRKKLSCEDGAVINDFDNNWKGITVFSAAGLYKTIKYYSHVLPEDVIRDIRAAFEGSAEWVSENIVPGFHAYINYYAAAAEVNAMYFRYTSKPIYLERARTLLSCCMELFTENGLLKGEGQPHGVPTAKGCFPIDIGYNAEESLPCLIDAALLIKDEKAFDILSSHAKKMLDFMLPDGAWDNSFGVRNNKWTYYGSRTSDGCLSALTLLSKRDPGFAFALEKHFSLLEKCTHNGLLSGGAFYHEKGQLSCIHHALCHSVSLTDAILNGISSVKIPGNKDKHRDGVHYYPELDTYRINKGKWTADITAYDYKNSNYLKGASHCSGGALSLLYHADKGPAITGSTLDYQLTEPFNMQKYNGTVKHSPLVMRCEYENDGIIYTTAADLNASVKEIFDEGAVVFKVRSHFFSLNGNTENSSYFADFIYRFYEDELTVEVNASFSHPGLRFILPVNENTVSVFTDTAHKSEKIFFLTGGFAADECSFALPCRLTLK